MNQPDLPTGYDKYAGGYDMDGSYYLYDDMEEQ